MTTDECYDGHINDIRLYDPEAEYFYTAKQNIEVYVKNNDIKKLEKYINSSEGFICDINAHMILSQAVGEEKIDIIYFVINKKIILPKNLYKYIQYTDNYDIINILIEEGNKHKCPTDFKLIHCGDYFVYDPIYYAKIGTIKEKKDFLKDKNIMLKNIQLTSEQFEQCKKYIDDQIQHNKQYLIADHYTYPVSFSGYLNGKTLIEYVSTNIDKLSQIIKTYREMYYPIQQVFNIHEYICQTAIFLGNLELLKYSFDQFSKYLPTNLLPRIKYGCLQHLKFNHPDYNCTEILNYLQNDSIPYKT